MKTKLLLFFALITLWSCKRDNSFNVKSNISQNFVCDAREIPYSARTQSIQSFPSYKGYSKIISKGYIIDYNTYITLFKGSDSLVNAYLRSLSNSVQYLQRRDSIITIVSYIKIFHEPDSLYANLDSVSSYCAKHLQGKVDICTLLTNKTTGGIAWIQGLGTVNYIAAVCGINGITGWVFAAGQIPPLDYYFDIEVVAHEEGHLLGSWHTFSCGHWYGGLFIIDASGRAKGYNEGGCPCFSSDSLPLDSFTVMSYGQLFKGINLHIGYGIQVADTIRSYIAQSQQFLIRYK